MGNWFEYQCATAQTSILEQDYSTQRSTLRTSFSIFRRRWESTTTLESTLFISLRYIQTLRGSSGVFTASCCLAFSFIQRSLCSSRSQEIVRICKSSNPLISSSTYFVSHYWLLYISDSQLYYEVSFSLCYSHPACFASKSISCSLAYRHFRLRRSFSSDSCSSFIFSFPYDSFKYFSSTATTFNSLSCLLSSSIRCWLFVINSSFLRTISRYFSIFISQLFLICFSSAAETFFLSSLTCLFALFSSIIARLLLSLSCSSADRSYYFKVISFRNCSLSTLTSAFCISTFLSKKQTPSFNCSFCRSSPAPLSFRVVEMRFVRGLDSLSSMISLRASRTMALGVWGSIRVKISRINDSNNFFSDDLIQTGLILCVQILLIMAETTKVHELDTSQAVFGKENQDKIAEKEDTLAAVGFFQMFRFAERRDIIYMTVGTFAALLLGAALPCFVLFWGDMTNSFGKSGSAIVDASKTVLFKFIYLAIGTFLMGWLMIYTWMTSGERQAVKCRKMYFSRLLEQEIGWFDCNNQSELSVKFTTDTLAFQGGIGEKVATLVQVIGTFIGGFVIAFIKGWLMTLVVISSIPLISFAGYMYMSIIQVKDKRNKEFYNEAGAYSEQAISSIKTVKQLNGEDFEEKQYRKTLDQVQKKALRFALIASAAMGALNFASMISYSLGFWFGSNCIEQNSSCPSNISGVSSPGDVLVVFFSILVASMNLSQMSPSMTKIAEAKMAAARIFSLLDRETLIKNPPNAIKPTEFHGKIRLSNVKFAYPKDKSKIILNDISMDFTTTSTALIGESGSGKSTIIQLLMRFYDPDEGSITLDGFDLRQLDLQWLREQIGYVGQEPVLFASSILDNLKLGNEKASIEDINEALKQAEAYDFVQDLEKKLDTFVGGGGNQISGGQKQRIAIARALLKKPKILLLDQATSALDRRNERLIQNTLNKISQNLTTITVAHRINTIKSSEYIYMLKKGEIDRKGTFKQVAPFIDSKIEEEKDSDKLEQIQEAPVQMNLAKHESKAEIAMRDKEAKETVLKEIKEQLLLKHEKGIYRRIFGYNRQHCCLFIVGIIASVLLGMVYPVFSVFLSQIINTLFNLQIGTDHTQARKDADLASLVFLLLAIGSFILVFIQSYVFATVGQEITKNIREQTYAKILKMPVPWFDYPQNSTGTLSSRLATDCLTVNGILTNYVGLVIQSVATLIAGVVVAFIYDWRTSLTAFALMPLMILAGAMRAYFKDGLSSKGDQVYKESSNLIMESMVNIRTVVSFGVENTVMSKYSSMLDGTYESMTKTAFWTGILYGLSQFLTNMCFALIFFIGSVYIENFGVTLLNVFTAIYAIFFAAITVGNNSHFMPDITEGKIAGASLFEILDSQDEEQIQAREESKLLKEGVNGNISLDSIAFKYESRNIDVFKNLTLEIRDGKKVAFVGPSGCGKSTIMQLLLRFYEPQAGTITINGENIKDYDIHYLRSVFGVVSQEPALFNGSFGENIRYNCAKATSQQIRAAAEKANALIFIEGKEDDEANRGVQEQHEEKKGFDKNVGIKGSHISGGQKQRVAIARAILRDPQILLLDEATSALDNRNEKKVQDTLDKIMTHKTTITVAHRIETIMNSDEIVVLEKGEIMERGTYAELMKLKRYFFNLQQGTQFL